MRGKEEKDDLGLVSKGITPACAGKRSFSWCPWAACRDHPRVCGEKISGDRASAPVWGSPPRVRGKASSDDKINEQNRITPACAGKSRLY